MVIKNFVNCVKRGVKSGFNKVMDCRPVRCCVGVALGLFASTCKALADESCRFLPVLWSNVAVHWTNVVAH